MSATNDLLAILKTKVLEQIASKDDDKKQVKAATALALSTLLLRVSQTNKEEVPEKARLELDAAIFDDREALKWPLLNSLKCCDLYGSFLGLPQVLEQTRRFLTCVSVSKMNNIMEEGLGKDLTACLDPQTLQWVEQILVFMTGAGRFKKDLGGFELKGPSKNKVKAAINLVKKRRKELENSVESHTKTQNRPKDAQIHNMDRDVRLQDKERGEMRTSGIESMIDEALAVKINQKQPKVPK